MSPTIINGADTIKAQKQKPGREEFKRMPGYWEKPAQVHRAGVGIVDGYEWGVKFRPNEHGRVTKQARQVHDLMAPAARAADRLYKERHGGGYEPRARMRGRTVLRAIGSKLFRLIRGRWVPA